MSSERTKRRRVKEELESVFNFLNFQPNLHSNEININEANDNIIGDNINVNVDPIIEEICFTPKTTIPKVFITHLLFD